jgi:hypothetical protein
MKIDFTKYSITKIFQTYFWSDFYYNTKWMFINFFKYFKIVSKQRPWDYQYILYMLDFQLKDLKKNMSKYSQEVVEDRDLRIKQINRAIELIANVNKDNYGERCGWKAPEKIWFEEKEETKNKPKEQKLYEIKDNSTQTDDELNEIFKKAAELEKQEFDELFSILRDNIKGWWY